MHFFLGDISPSEDDDEAHAVPSRILAKGTLLDLNQVQKKKLEEKIQAIYKDIPIYGCVIRSSNISGKTRTLVTCEFKSLFLNGFQHMLVVYSICSMTCWLLIFAVDLQKHCFSYSNCLNHWPLLLCFLKFDSSHVTMG